MQIGIVDTGCANISSVRFALHRLGLPTIVTSETETLETMDKLILPGVGASAHAMNNLNTRGLTDFLKRWPKPMLGICLGMQLLFDESEEGGPNLLGIIDAPVKALSAQELPLPHMGWNTLANFKNDPLLEGVEPGSHVYFVHSFAVPAGDYTLATSSYGEIFSAVVRRGNVWGCQFHPERSSKTGSKILSNFVEHCT